MKIYITEKSKNCSENVINLINDIKKLSDIKIVSNINDCEIVLILPGGLNTYYDLFYAINCCKNCKIILYNDNYFYSSMIRNLYKLYEDKIIDKVPNDYMAIEYEYDKILEIIKEMLLWKN